MGSARLAKAADQGCVRCFQKPERDISAGLTFQRRIHAGKLLQGFALANVCDESDFGLLFRLPAQFEKLAHETDRKIIDAKKSPVLERPEKSAFSRAAQAGDHYERGRFHVSGSIQPILPS